MSANLELTQARPPCQLRQTWDTTRHQSPAGTPHPCPMWRHCAPGSLLTSRQPRSALRPASGRASSVSVLTTPAGVAPFPTPPPAHPVCRGPHRPLHGRNGPVALVCSVRAPGPRGALPDAPIMSPLARQILSKILSTLSKILSTPSKIPSTLSKRASARHIHRQRSARTPRESPKTIPPLLN